MPTKRYALRIFRLFGISVYLHWTWFLAFFVLASLPREYNSVGWNIMEVLALFFIVLLHEFGHQLACRQTGGQTHDIVLWPMGGVAYVSPPPRPGAQLWSIAAGPLVNVILAPLFALVVSFSNHLDWSFSYPNLFTWVHVVYYINITLLVFNMLPIYPLDGGQILRSILWFFLGKANSLRVASLIGFAGACFVVFYAIQHQWLWLGTLMVFVLIQCWQGFKQSGILKSRDQLPRREDCLCPFCKAAPVIGNVWRCPQCHSNLDPFASQGACPGCNFPFNTMQCLECGNRSPLPAWRQAPIPPVISSSP